MSQDLENKEDTESNFRDVPVAWEALEDAFENNAPEVHSYLHLDTGEVIRIVDGIADPGMHQRVMRDSLYMRVDTVSSREQYRWMERFIATVREPLFREKLVRAIDGKGAFRRFKDVLMSYPADRERWFAFRSERLRACMEAWLYAHSITVVERQKWQVPASEEAAPDSESGTDALGTPRNTRADAAEGQRARINQIVDLLPARELGAALAFVEFLRDRRHLPRAEAKASPVIAVSENEDGVASADAPAEPEEEAEATS